jgi:cytochrome b subunit of formate dehydrogenase
MLYLVGKSEIKPLMGRFSYIEKMEYWAVVWGTFIMGGTGMVLWFENYFLKYVGTMGMDIATAIHYYEAILASLAILVWHFYFIFLNPDVFPMNKAWFKGYLSREQMEHEHPLELMELEGTGETEETEESTEEITEAPGDKPSEVKEELLDKKETKDQTKGNKE